MKHYNKPHQNVKSVSVVASEVLNAYKQELQKELKERQNDDWLRNLASSCLVYYELTGSKQKTEKFVQKLADKLAEYDRIEKPTEDIVKELSRATDIELIIQT